MQDFSYYCSEVEVGMKSPNILLQSQSKTTSVTFTFYILNFTGDNRHSNLIDILLLLLLLRLLLLLLLLLLLHFLGPVEPSLCKDFSAQRKPLFSAYLYWPVWKVFVAKDYRTG